MTQRTTALVLMALDIVASVAVFNLISHARGVTEAGDLLVWPLSAPLCAFVVSIYLVQGYRNRTDMLSVDYASLHAIATVGAMIATLLLTYVVFPDGYGLKESRAVVALGFAALVPLTLSYRRLFYLRNSAARQNRKIVFIGDHDSRTLFAEQCKAMRVGQKVVYSTYSTVANDASRRRVESAVMLQRGHDGGHSSHGGTSDPFAVETGLEASGLRDTDVRPFAEVLNDVQHGRMAVEAIVLRESGRDLAAEVSNRLVELYFAGVPTYTLELFHEVYWQKIPLYRLNQTWLFQQGFKIAREPVFERAKRASDIVFAAVGLIAATPLMFLGAIAIWLEDRGPALFKQTRIGRNHVPFTIFKLRTMKVVDSGSRYTQPGDARITTVGRLLRASRLDELPQLWNVLRGDMSLIGPRAEWDTLVAGYEREIPCYHFRHLVRPGITGWAQVNYPYGASIEDTLRKLEYDLYYIRHFSFRLDATIVLKTIHVMLFGKGR